MRFTKEMKKQFRRVALRALYDDVYLGNLSFRDFIIEHMRIMSLPPRKVKIKYQRRRNKEICPIDLFKDTFRGRVDMFRAMYIQLWAHDYLLYAGRDIRCKICNKALSYADKVDRKLCIQCSPIQTTNCKIPVSGG